MNSLSDEEIDELKELFSIVDTDGGGSIDRNEFKTLMQMLKVNVPNHIINRIFDEIDVDNGGSISFNEFVTFMCSTNLRTFNKNDILDAFDDVLELTAKKHGKRNKIDINDLVDTIVNELPSIHHNRQTVMELVSHLPLDKDGKFDYKKYVNNLF